MVQLTIAIPAFNVESYLKKCLESILEFGENERLEVLVIDDGSQDSTAEIAQRYEEKYPKTVRLIRKENGGHGSVINRAVEEASGRYIKIIDADDWIVSENLDHILNYLEKTNADAVITAFHTIDMITGKKIAYTIENYEGPEEITIEQLVKEYDRFAPCCTFHGLMYRVEPYRAAKIHLSEGIFYEDQEYAALPFSYVKSIGVFSEFFYEYQIGNVNQSVSLKNVVKRIGHLEKVAEAIIRCQNNAVTLPSASRFYIQKKIENVATSYFSIVLVKDPDNKEGRKQALQFYDKLQRSAPAVLGKIKNKYQILCLLNRLYVSPVFYQRLLDTIWLRKIRKRYLK